MVESKTASADLLKQNRVEVAIVTISVCLVSNSTDVQTGEDIASKGGRGIVFKKSFRDLLQLHSEWLLGLAHAKDRCDGLEAEFFGSKASSLEHIVNGVSEFNQQISFIASFGFQKHCIAAIIDDAAEVDCDFCVLRIQALVDFSVTTFQESFRKRDFVLRLKIKATKCEVKLLRRQNRTRTCQFRDEGFDLALNLLDFGSQAETSYSERQEVVWHSLR